LSDTNFLLNYEVVRPVSLAFLLLNLLQFAELVVPGSSQAVEISLSVVIEVRVLSLSEEVD